MCNCIEEFNAYLNEKLNCQGKIIVSYFTDTEGNMTAFPSGMKFVYHRRKSVPIVPNYCPFCGKPYKIKDEDDEIKTQRR